MKFMHPDNPVERHGNKLPHWQQEDALQFITFRLKDSVPQPILRDWKGERDQWLARNPEPWDDVRRLDYRKLFTEKLEAHLDRGLGCCLLRDPQNRNYLAETMMAFNGLRVYHEAWVIMPNHVHVLCQPRMPIAKLIQSWKGVSARRIGAGSIWQSNYRDTLIRGEKHFFAVVRYIRNNPAGLPPDHFSLWESDRAKQVESI